LNSQAKEIQFSDLLNNPPKGAAVNDGLIWINIFQANDMSQGGWLHPKNLLIGLYSSVTIYLFIAGSLLTAVAFFILIYLRRSLTDLMMIATYLWVLYLSRIAIVVLVDITSFPAIDNLYLLPAFPLLCSASIVGIAAFINIVMSMNNVTHPQNMNIGNIIKNR
jgi:hypothetical protein